MKGNKRIHGRKSKLYMLGIEDEVWTLHLQGYNYSDIARKLNDKYPRYSISYQNVMKLISGIESGRYPRPTVKVELNIKVIFNEFEDKFMEHLSDNEANDFDKVLADIIETYKNPFSNKEITNYYQLIKFFFLPAAEKYKRIDLRNLCNNTVQKLVDNYTPVPKVSI
jgi:hypothetical protein